MYVDFFHLKGKPFELTSSPPCLYMGEVHKEALAFLAYGIKEKKGFVLLTGDVGTGKTTMVQALLAQIDKARVEYVYVSNPPLTPADFMNYITHEALKRELGLLSRTEFLFEFEAFLRRLQEHDKRFLLIIDEAQRLPFVLLEEIRLLSNLEAAGKGSIILFLIGQPDLNKRLLSSACRPLLQRISIHHHMEPLTRKETEEYLVTILRAAGAKDAYNIFSKRVIRTIHRLSGGYPRGINTLADNVLLLGFAKGTRSITPAMVRACSKKMRPKVRPVRKAAAASPVSRKRRPEPSRIPGMWGWAAVSLVLLIMALVAAAIGGGIDRWLPVPAWHAQPADSIEDEQEEAPNVEDSLPPLDRTRSGADKNLDIEAGPTTEEGSDPVPEPPKPPISVSTAPEVMRIQETGESGQSAPQDAAQAGEDAVLRPSSPSAPWKEQNSAALQNPEGWKTIEVKEGDTLRRLTENVYGRCNMQVLQIVKKVNPSIQDLNLIYVNQRILFPPPSQFGDYLYEHAEFPDKTS